ncbi:DUF3147 family protein [Dictyobacter formicarum]|uniref:DUF3147 family protein n=1 Tax=Dictyobacter formicarum TaxID=2778368 RepID=A0ABQ3VAM6_9CHLR|nr:DUF3147 family protein [Dictyobacter formicarum]GHO82809.1 hypothetical protein KSZ_08150 [Dictyobacter formicarum]
MLLEYLAKFIAGGLLVCVFALISQICMPKQFAGIFSSVPSVLLAGLAITLIMQGADKATLSAEGAIAGAIGMVLYCIVATPAIRRYKALRGSLLSLFIWCLGSLCAFVLLSVSLKW